MSPIISVQNLRKTYGATIAVDDISFEVAERLYEELRAAGFAVLYDDREETPGVKFNDADLLGIPFRVTVSPRTLQKDSVELKKRSEKESELVPLDGIVEKLKELGLP